MPADVRSIPLPLLQPKRLFIPLGAVNLERQKLAGHAEREAEQHTRAYIDLISSVAPAANAWAEVPQLDRDVRGPLRDALGYTVRQKVALRAFLEDGRLELTNNGSERALRQVAVGRKAWLFSGSDGHAERAAELMSLVASAKLHKLNPQRYFAELIRVLPHWPRGRYLELCPAEWAATRARLDAAQLAVEYGPLTVPSPVPSPVEQERSAN